jgi:hypothetical protein
MTELLKTVIWTEQQLNGTELLGLRLTKTPEVPNTINGRKLSQLSDGLLNSSKRLAICELRLSKTQPVAESEFLGRLDLPI